MPTLEADFHRFYHLDLVDLWRGRLTWRKLENLVNNLPRESATVREVSGTGQAEWTKQVDLLAHAVDALNDLVWVTVQVNSTKGSQNKRPERYPRPQQAKALITSAGKSARQHATIQEMKQFFGGRR